MLPGTGVGHAPKPGRDAAQRWLRRKRVLQGDDGVQVTAQVRKRETREKQSNRKKIRWQNIRRDSRPESRETRVGRSVTREGGRREGGREGLRQEGGRVRT